MLHTYFQTRILVTHNLACLSAVDQVIVMKGGRISEISSYQELLSKKEGDFSHYLDQISAINLGKSQMSAFIVDK